MHRKKLSLFFSQLSKQLDSSPSLSNKQTIKKPWLSTSSLFLNLLTLEMPTVFIAKDLREPGLSYSSLMPGIWVSLTCIIPVISQLILLSQSINRHFSHYCIHSHISFLFYSNWSDSVKANRASVSWVTGLHPHYQNFLSYTFLLLFVSLKEHQGTGIPILLSHKMTKSLSFIHTAIFCRKVWIHYNEIRCISQGWLPINSLCKTRPDALRYFQFCFLKFTSFNEVWTF